MKANQIAFAMNRNTRRAVLLHGDIFRHWEMVQAAFAVGILLPDGSTANGIGRCKSLKLFTQKANHSRVTVLVPDDCPYCLEIEIHKGSKSKVSPSVWRSWTGKRFIDGHEVKGDRFYYLSSDVYHGKVAA